MAIKRIGSRGQLTLGKQYAGQAALIDEIESGVWEVSLIPDGQLWAHQEPAKSKIEAAMKWADTHPAQASDLDEVEKMLRAEWARRERAQ